MRSIMTFLLGTALAAPAFGAGNHNHQAVPTLQGQTTTAVTVLGNTVTLTFGPIDLPAAHDGDLAASIPLRLIVTSGSPHTAHLILDTMFLFA